MCPLNDEVAPLTSISPGVHAHARRVHRHKEEEEDKMHIIL